MLPIQPDAVRIETLVLPSLAANKSRADVLRLDRIHEQVSGNKWFKLRYYLESAKAAKKTTIVTRGGAWSNHILATAAACRMLSFKCMGIIRGEKPALPSFILQEAEALGMELHFLSREDFREGKFPVELDSRDHYFIPAGGYGPLGARGAATILDHCTKENYTHICCAAGTGTMAAGLLQAVPARAIVVAVSVLKNNSSLEKDILALAGKAEAALQVIHDFHEGGYAKHSDRLLEFMNTIYRTARIPLDFVYTGKLFLAIQELAAQDFFPPGSKLLLVHSGGLQGNASLDKGTLIF